MKKLIFLFVIIFILLVGLAISQEYTKTGRLPFKDKTPTATIKNHAFKLLLAKTAEEKEIGLSKQKSLPANKGMLFIFDQPDYYSFWAKKMQFPIDIIFISGNLIVSISPDVHPPKNESEDLPIIRPKEPSDLVLEINAGLSKKYKFNVGDAVKIDNLQ